MRSTDSISSCFRTEPDIPAFLASLELLLLVGGVMLVRLRCFTSYHISLLSMYFIFGFQDTLLVFGVSDSVLYRGRFLEFLSAGVPGTSIEHLALSVLCSLLRGGGDASWSTAIVLSVDTSSLPGAAARGADETSSMCNAVDGLWPSSGSI